jgi:hypothetical protein
MTDSSQQSNRVHFPNCKLEGTLTNSNSPIHIQAMTQTLSHIQGYDTAQLSLDRSTLVSCNFCMFS